MVKNLPSSAADVRDMSSIPESGRSPGGGHSTPLQSSCLENSMDKGAWLAIVYRVARSWTQLNQLSMHAYMYFSVLDHFFFFCFLKSIVHIFFFSLETYYFKNLILGRPCITDFIYGRNVSVK